jgi:nucleoside phosphorylase
MGLGDGNVVVEEAGGHIGTVVVLTALNLERDAVAARLTDLSTRVHPAGTVFKVGSLPGTRWRVALAVVGDGNLAAGVITERAVSLFDPAAVLFVGVAGALRDDVAIGDVVVATRIYAYHGGKEDGDGFRSRPRSFPTSHQLDQLAREVEAERSWAGGPPPAVHFKPIAAGEVVLDSRTSPVAQHLRLHYDDAVAIETESAGVASAGHLNRSLPVAAIRGISDTASGEKSETDRAGCQQLAADRAAAFALALVAVLQPVSGWRQGLAVWAAKASSLTGSVGGAAWVRSRAVLAILAGATTLAAYLTATQSSDSTVTRLVYSLYFLIRLALLVAGAWLLGWAEPRAAVGAGIVTATAWYFVADAVQSVGAIGTAAAWLELLAAIALAAVVARRLWPFTEAPRPRRLAPPARRALAYTALAAAGAQFVLLFVAIPGDEYATAVADGGGALWALLAIAPVAALSGVAALTRMVEAKHGYFVGSALVTYLSPEVYLTLGSLMLGAPSVYLGYGGWGPRGAAWFALLQAALMLATVSATLLLVRDRSGPRPAPALAADRSQP